MDIVTIPVGMLGTNCYILSSNDKSCAVIDPGSHPERIIARIAEEGLTVRYILITHGHHDHIGGVKRLAAEYPEAEVYIGKNDLEMLTDTGKSLAMSRYREPDGFIINKAEGLEDGRELDLDELKIRVVETAGHTKGGVCFICGNAIFSGDTLFCGDVGRCDLYGGDYGVLKSSLRKLMELEDDYNVYPGHGGYTTLKSERVHNIYIAEALAEK